MKKLREKGITLVALVVTVIILLILAGVTISQIGGNNGLFSKVKQAVEKYKIAQEKEEGSINAFEKYLINTETDDDIISEDGSSSQLNQKITNLEQTVGELRSEIEEMEKNYSLDNKSMQLLSTLLNEEKVLKIFDMNSFNRTETSLASKYIQYDSINNRYNILKSSFYTIYTTVTGGRQDLNSGSIHYDLEVHTNKGIVMNPFRINDIVYNGANCMANTFFLPKGDYIILSAKVQGEAKPITSSMKVDIYALE